ncbi:MAG TPA: isoprenylcysteine carboxylmethyltransferase family protein [Ktedonobacteraceae bacterium]
MTHWAYWLTVICWGTFCLVWAIGWIYNLLKAPATQKRSRFLSLWIISIVIIVLVTQFIPRSIWTFVTFIIPWLQIAGAACLIIFTAFTLWARWVLGTMWSSSPEIKVGHQLRTDGPYRITRHPIYTGILGMLLGTLLISQGGAWILYFTIIVVALVIKISSEERLLKETFGEQYIQYQHHVPQLVPGLQLIIRQR